MTGPSKTTGRRPWQLPPAAKPLEASYLDAVTIGARQPLNDRIRLVAYDRRWPSLFALAAGKVRSALAGRALSIEHVGSTAVFGLAAKPIIDMLLVVEDSADETSYVPPLEAEGFILRTREPGWFQHRFLVLRSGGMVWHLHVFSEGCEEIERMLAFRDWLRTHADDRQRYEDAKRELAARVWKHLQNYADAKTGIVREILTRAHARLSAADESN